MLDHLDLNVKDLATSRRFYEAVLGKMGYRITVAEPGWLILARDGQAFYVTLVQTRGEHVARGFHRRGIGLNHLAFAAPSRRDVDAFHEWLAAEGISILYGGPLDMEPDRYAVFFEDPDRLKVEYVYRPS